MRSPAPALVALVALALAPPRTVVALDLEPVGPGPASPRVAGGTDAGSALRADLERLLRGSGLPRAAWSVLAVSLDRGDTLFAYASEQPRGPASNMKLFTSAAALYYLGPEFHYTTYLLTDGVMDNGVLRGDLFLYGTGDPTLSDRFHGSKTEVFERFADELARLGVRRIEGAVVGDASHFTGPEVSPAWGDHYLEHFYAAPASALSFNENVTLLRIRPGASVGAPPQVTVIPEDAVVALVNNARTVASPRGARLSVDRPHAASPILISGRISREHGGVWRTVTVPDPALFAASTLRAVLLQRGMEVTGPPRAIRDPVESPVSGQGFSAPGLVDAGALRVLAVHHSPPLSAILEVVNKRSHNLYAELLLKTLGRVVAGQGSFEAGARVVRDFLTGVVGVPPTEIEIHDGSGLSPRNRATAGALVTALRFLADSPTLWEPFWNSLPEAGSANGLRRMFRTAAAGNLRAKTGTLERVSALSGYVRTGDGERVAFSILVNEAPSTWRVKRIEDQIAVRFATFQRNGNAVPASAVSGGPGIRHRVQPGQTFASIARRYGVSLSAILAANPGIVPEHLRPGQLITIPDHGAPRTAGQVHRVRPGETLSSIARAYGVSLSALRAANPELDPRKLPVGQPVRIPTRT